MANAWSDSEGLDINREIRSRARTGLSAAADWAAGNQARQNWPHWNANAGRLPYHVHLPTDAYILSTSWNTARAAQGMLAAWKILDRPDCLATAEWSLEYIKSLQYFGPECPDANGLFIEETPVGDHVYMRDSIECAQALLVHHILTRDTVSLMRARCFFDKFAEMMDSGRWPKRTCFRIPRLEAVQFLKADFEELPVESCWNNFAGALPFAHLSMVTGDKRYLACAERLGELILNHCVGSDGALVGHGMDPIHVSGSNRVLDNDDGLCVALVALWSHTGKAKYLDAATANGYRWIGKGNDLPVTYATLPALMIIMADLARATGSGRFTGYIEDMADRFFALQILRDERRLVQGAFRGEDMAGVYRKGCDRGDFVSLRSTAYGLLALGKIAAGSRAQWNPAYSGFTV